MCDKCVRAEQYFTAPIETEIGATGAVVVAMAVEQFAAIHLLLSEMDEADFSGPFRVMYVAAQAFVKSVTPQQCVDIGSAILAKVAKNG